MIFFEEETGEIKFIFGISPRVGKIAIPLWNYALRIN